MAPGRNGWRMLSAVSDPSERRLKRARRFVANAPSAFSILFALACGVVATVLLGDGHFFGAAVFMVLAAAAVWEDR